MPSVRTTPPAPACQPGHRIDVASSPPHGTDRLRVGNLDDKSQHVPYHLPGPEDADCRIYKGSSRGRLRHGESSATPTLETANHRLLARYVLIPPMLATLVTVSTERHQDCNQHAACGRRDIVPGDLDVTLYGQSAISG